VREAAQLSGRTKPERDSGAAVQKGGVAHEERQNGTATTDKRQTKRRCAKVRQAAEVVCIDESNVEPEISNATSERRETCA